MSSRGGGVALGGEALEIGVVNDLRELAGIAAKIDGFCAERNLQPQVAYAVNLAVDELLTNTISYGYDDDRAHRIEIIVRLESGTLVVVIVDDSMAFDVTNAPQPDLDASLADRAVHGLGMFLVHQMMDGVEYRRAEGCNVVTLTKSIGDVDSAEG